MYLIGMPIHCHFFASFILSENSCFLIRKAKYEESLAREPPLLTSDIRVGRGSKIAPKIERYRVGDGR